jgi:hypothetical protein
MAEPSTLAERRRAIEISCLGLVGYLIGGSKDLADGNGNLWQLKRRTSRDLTQIYRQLTELAIAAKGATAYDITPSRPDSTDAEESDQSKGAVDQARPDRDRKRGGHVRRDDGLKRDRKK